MEDKNTLLRHLPSVDELVKHEDLREELDTHGHCVVTAAIRESVAATRIAVLEGTVSEINLRALVGDVVVRVEDRTRYRLHPVINATGVILHTNLGRAPVSERVAAHAANVMSHYNTLEYDIDSGARGRRADAVEALLKELTGAEAAVIVNNNAAAVLLALTAICKGLEIVVSRGELVEIGGAFRIPEVMEASGATLREVGTTNKTRLSDYQRAVSSQTGALLKVHTSNYRVVGFTEAVELTELKALAHQISLPVIYDLGSGAMTDFSVYGIRHEPTVADAIEAGADVVCFSGDKLLGGPQCGMVVGSALYVDKLKQHPLMRALRVDKMTLAVLEATLQLYRDDAIAAREIPILRMLATDPSELRARSDKLAARLNDVGLKASVIDTDGVLGGGSAPTETFASCAVALDYDGHADELAAALRRDTCPVIARIEDGRIHFDLRTVAPDEDDTLETAILEACGIHDA